MLPGVPKDSANGSECQQQGRTTSIADLSADLLSSIFSRLGPAPQDIAIISLVCREWDKDVRNFTWRALCMQVAPGLCSALGYGDSDTGAPPGGFMGLYKLIVYCPGLHPALTDQLDMYKIPFDRTTLRRLGHLMDNCLTDGFWTGPDVMRALNFRAAFWKDRVFLSRVCKEDSALKNPLRHWMGQETWEHGCRGIIKDFPSSQIYAELLEERFEGNMGRGNEMWLCPYCNSASYLLHEDTFFENGDLFDGNYVVYTEGDLEWFGEEPSHCSNCRSLFDAPLYRKRSPGSGKAAVRVSVPSRTIGRVCSQGHLLLACIGAVEERNGPHVPRSGEGLAIRASGLISFLAEQSSERISNVQELLDFKALVSTGDLPEMRRRVETLARKWPSEAWDQPGAGFAGVLDFLNNRRAFQGLTAPGSRERLMSYVWTGSPSLDECILAVTLETLPVFPEPTN